MEKKKKGVFELKGMLKLNLGETLTQHRHLLLLLLQEVTCWLPTTPPASILPPQKILMQLRKDVPLPADGGLEEFSPQTRC